MNFDMEGTNHFRSFDGTSIYYEEFGSGKPIVLVHGWTGSHSVWERTVHDLAKKFRVVTMDNRGHGDSAKPNTNYDFDEFSSDLKELIDQRELNNALLVGWSMGVSISLRYFERFRAHGYLKTGTDQRSNKVGFGSRFPVHDEPRIFGEALRGKNR